MLILGGGIVGSNAAQMAAGLGADVTIADINLSTPALPERDVTEKCQDAVRLGSEAEKRSCRTWIWSVGSVLIPGDKAPHLITRDMLANDAAGYGTWWM